MGISMAHSLHFRNHSAVPYGESKRITRMRVRNTPENLPMNPWDGIPPRELRLRVISQQKLFQRLHDRTSVSKGRNTPRKKRVPDICQRVPASYYGFPESGHYGAKRIKRLIPLLKEAVNGKHKAREKIAKRKALRLKDSFGLPYDRPLSIAYERFRTVPGIIQKLSSSSRR
jgi:hypothetical protein